MNSLSEWVRPGTYGVFFFEDGKTAYAKVLSALEDEPEYVKCVVYTEDEPTDLFDVHVTKFVYKLSRNQFIVAWYSGFPNHIRRLQTIINLVKGGDA